jgi:NAD(P)-dependent dehydrogenase (short-subunit alcohol dehydrogenase family)
MRLENKVSIVTGAAGGIGRAFAIRLGQEGAKVVIADIKECEETAALVRETGADVLPVQVDVSNEQQTLEMARLTAERFGRIDILVNDAAIASGMDFVPLMEVDLDLWDRVMDVNVKGTFLCTRAVFPYMKEQGKGKIINIASGVFIAGSVGIPHYVSSKAAIWGLTRVLAKELGQNGINVNAIAPGYTESGIQLNRDRAPWSPVVPGKAIERAEVPEDLTGTMVYLASEDSDFVTGNLHVVNGGAQLW